MNMYETSEPTEEELNQILNKWKNPYRKDYTTVKNSTLPKHYLALQKDIDNFEVFDSDVWICSYPKTGTTWVSELVWLIVNNFDYEKAKIDMHERIRFLDLSFVFHNDEAPITVHEALSDSINYTKNQPHPRVIKTHLPFHLLPKQIRNEEKQPRIVYITRNPMDACVSYYYHCASMNFTGTLEDLCKLYLSNKTNYGSFWDNVLPFWHRRGQPNILFLKFEDMKKNLVNVIQKTAAFLGKVVSAEEMQRLQKHLSFESMKNNPAVNGGKIIEFMKVTGSEKSQHIRAGAVGGHKQEMPPYLIKVFQKWMEVNLEGTGLTF